MNLRTCRSACCLLALALALALAGSVGAQPAPTDRHAMVVQRILVNGQARTALDDRLQIEVLAPGAKLAIGRLAVGEVVVPGTSLAARAGVVVVLARQDPPAEIVVEPMALVTVQRSDATGVQAQVGAGVGRFRLAGRLDFFFGVDTFRKLYAIAKGTRFSVEADAACEGRATTAPCVAVVLDEGRLEIETLRPVQLADAPRPPAAGAEEATVSEVAMLNAGQTLRVSLDPQLFALRFDNLAQARAHFAYELARIGSDAPPEQRLRALRNLLTIERLGERNQQALDLAQRGLALARELRDTGWTFRFLIDAAFSQWRLKRDTSAFPMFEEALAMAEADTTHIDPESRAALFDRYGAIRFAARNRAAAAPDLDRAEALILRSLVLREALHARQPGIELSLSLYDLGVLQRIGRDDAGAALPLLERAVQLRRTMLGSRDDRLSAEMMTELAIASEELIRSRLHPGGNAAELAALVPVGEQFDSALGMLRRLFAPSGNRVVGVVARRVADFHVHLAADLAARGQPEQAAGAAARAEALYDEAIALLLRSPGNSAAELRFAHDGLARARQQRGNPAGAVQAWQQALEGARQALCEGLPERPTIGWVQTLLKNLAGAAVQAGQPERAVDFLRRAGQADAGLGCIAPSETAR